MIADVANVWTVLVALVVAVPAILAAIASARNRNELRTSNGTTLGAQVEALGRDVDGLKDAAIQNRLAILWLQRELVGREDDFGRADA